MDPDLQMPHAYLILRRQLQEEEKIRGTLPDTLAAGEEKLANKRAERQVREGKLAAARAAFSTTQREVDMELRTLVESSRLLKTRLTGMLAFAEDGFLGIIKAIGTIPTEREVTQKLAGLTLAPAGEVEAEANEVPKEPVPVQVEGETSSADMGADNVDSADVVADTSLEYTEDSPIHREGGTQVKEAAPESLPESQETPGEPPDPMETSALERQGISS